MKPFPARKLQGGMLLIATGTLTLDTGWGRRSRALGPQVVRIAAPRQLVFELVAAPYGIDPPRAFREKIEVLDRGRDMVLAAHVVARSLAELKSAAEDVAALRPDTRAIP